MYLCSNTLCIFSQNGEPNLKLKEKKKIYTYTERAVKYANINQFDAAKRFIRFVYVLCVHTVTIMCDD